MYIPAKINANLARILQKYLLFPSLYFAIVSFSLAQNSNDSLFQQKQGIQDSLILSGYWEAQVHLHDDGSTKTHKGRPYFWSSVRVYENSRLLKIHSINKLKGEIANQFRLSKQLNDYVKNNYHRKGYPLAKAELKIENVADNRVDAVIKIRSQNYILYDSLEIKGDGESVNSGYLSNFLNIQYEQPFDINAYNNIGDQIEQLDYLKLSASPKLLFANNRAKIRLQVDKVKSNQFDAIIGIVPEGGRTNLTGQVDARLRNLLKRGVGFDLFWQKYSVNSQVLSTNIQQSYAFSSPVGINFGFQLLQEDSTFLQTDLQIGIQYPIWNSISIGLSYRRLNNNVLRDFSEQEVSNLSPIRSSYINAGLIKVNWRNQITYPQLRDYIFAELDFSIGNKQMRNFSTLPTEWQNVPENSISFNGAVKVHLQRIIGKRILIEAIPQYSAVQNKALSQNDLLRLGGLQNLRGFDRNFYYTRYFGLLNINYRYFLDKKSSFFLLTDIARLQSGIDWVYASGAGLDIKSKNGWFRIIYALGSEIGNMPEFSQGKVHFGYIAVF